MGLFVSKPKQPATATSGGKNIIHQGSRNGLYVVTGKKKSDGKKPKVYVDKSKSDVTCSKPS